MCVQLYMHVQVYTCVQVSMYMCTQVCGDQRTALDVVPQVQSTFFFFETGFFIGL